MSTYLKRLREAKGITQLQLAETVGCSRSLIARFETETDFPPSEEVALALAKTLDGDPDILMLASGKVSQRLRDILQKHPTAFAEMIRELKDQPEHAILRVVREVKDGKW